ncbi:UDP-2,4-diacetamido-2,4,6-trideoxy-beta-L-altropyranose hydrolase [Nesterenkonia sedimenti]|uniref:UDP-2,4-diacetamido-2,4, 6-trideoxy-beta-L-altropyranose hydrolase n=1 Tax=Nesterenkonia sedimenti TaxID=1463632 RepID=UPI002D21B9C1|nr:UDP-2,4-diacetamido-2,4,6-trideoxy-beta-L-altropyranose hydrolase [Nesterenkonia sedimenti]
MEGVGTTGAAAPDGARTFLIRADASVQIGSGHVMRCLTLADELSARGHRCIFVSRNLPGDLINQTRLRGYEVFDLRPLVEGANCDLPAASFLYEAWLAGGWERDASETIEATRGLAIDWIVVDHYGIDRRWEEQLRRAHPHSGLMVIDDLADRHHAADVVLDQNLGRREEDYEGLIPTNSSVLAGLTYSLLRPEFAQHRKTSLSRKQQTENGVSRLLINLGGVDKDNFTEQLLVALETLTDVNESFTVDVVMGPTAPHLEAVQQTASKSPWRITVHAGTSKMAKIMSEADVAIGAGGGTSWERCCMGLPTIVAVLAENQRRLADKLEEAGVARRLDMDDLPASLTHAWRVIADDARRREMSQRAAQLVDGRGVERVSEVLLGSELLNE